MKKLYCVNCGKIRKFEKPKISYILEKTLVLSIIYSECKNQEKYNSKIKKKKKKHNKIVLLAKSKLNSIEVLISKALIDSVINHDEFVLINNVLKEYDEMKEEIKNLKRLSCPSDLATRQFTEDFGLFIKQCYHIV